MAEDLLIDVHNVSMMFNLSANKEAGLKEYFINLVNGRADFREFWALQNINLKVKKGDSIALIGQNGSGKSTLLKIIAGIIKPTRGSVEVKGSIAPLIELRGGFDGALSARENIYLSGAMYGHTKTYIERRFDEIVDFAEIDSFLDVPVKKFSSGMLSRLGFAIATCVDADIIIADEVLAVGDTKFRSKCERRIKQMLDDGTTILFVSHNTSQVKKVCEKAIWLDKGQVIQRGTSNDVCDAYLDAMKGY